MYRIRIIPRTLHFKRPAGTSRGVYTTRKVWYLLVSHRDMPGVTGIGECAPLPDLSCDASPYYERLLDEICREVENAGCIDYERLRPYPSVLFGLETAMRHLEARRFALWDTPFSRGEAGIPINGLVWMGDYDAMLAQVEAKMAAGFHCIKLKIGAIDFDRELDLIRHIRRHYPADRIEIRVDANGAFTPEEAPGRLARLAELDLHSIEQPIRAGQWEAMARLAAQTPLPIALDEELIGWHNPGDKNALIRTIRPQYIILKPTLHGGYSGCREWIAEAEDAGSGWWLTSALESNIGLNAIAQWCAELGTSRPQGLGTGALFTDNVPMPLDVRNDSLWYAPPSNGKAEFNTTSEIELENSISENNISRLKNTELHNPELDTFLDEWSDEGGTVTVQTSGSTGHPKTLSVRKDRMAASAVMTCSYLGLRKGDKALLCMSLKYIGARMMVVRALVWGLDLQSVPPSGHPLAALREAPVFAAMVPLQVYNTLRVPYERELLKQIRVLIIGGGAVDPALENELKQLPNAVYSTYGMTETLSHVALRRLNGPDASGSYTPLPGVGLSLSAEGTLVIDAPHLADGPLETNDLAELQPDGTFRLLGRKDNVINTGGIKIRAEELETRLKTVIDIPLAVTSVSDPKFGEAVVLLLERELTPEQTGRIREISAPGEYPRHILLVDSIPLAGNGKIDRAAARTLAGERVYARRS